MDIFTDYRTSLLTPREDELARAAERARLAAERAPRPTRRRRRPSILRRLRHVLGRRLAPHAVTR
ncbi:hypothetical protein [Protaetiibacter larvae]|uniref:Uncharacterized protein n=1 Tax=Protaetiibacter larvae TaxID=2592654 RepID=A0A5C1YBA1_9MICO|nr:hypothetical protein [Protaetiibacter larvae]QEO10172.1 hypothetical protein FLP23_09220 [Protaetiibacter larvae]